VLVLGIIAGLMYYAIGGWWYRLRLRWCGADDTQASLARRVLMFSGQVIAVPTIV
jgi:hypothetical protein